MPMKNVDSVRRFIISTAKEKINPRKWHHFSKANQLTKTVIETADFKRFVIPVHSPQNTPFK